MSWRNTVICSSSSGILHLEMVRLWSDRQRTMSSPPTLLFRAQVDPTTFMMISAGGVVSKDDGRNKRLVQQWRFSSSSKDVGKAMLTVRNNHMGKPPRLYSGAGGGGVPESSCLKTVSQWDGCVCIDGSVHSSTLSQWARSPGYRDLQSVWGMALQMETNVRLLWVICGNPAVDGLGTLQV